MLGLVLTLSLATAPKPTVLKIEVKPEKTVVYVDGKKRGSGSKTITLPLTPGVHTIKLVHGRDEHQETIAVKKGQTTKWSFAFEDDRRPVVSPAGENAEKKAPEAGAPSDSSEPEGPLATESES